MGILSTLLTFPVSGPMKAAQWVVEEIHDLAKREYSDPAFIRKQLAELEAQLEAGALTEDEFEEIELVLLTRLKDAEVDASAGED